jgi:hypothetical protein
MTELFHDEGAMPAPIPPAVSNPAFRNWIRGKLLGLSVFNQFANQCSQDWLSSTYWAGCMESTGVAAAPMILCEPFSARNTTTARFSFFHPGSMVS